MADIFFNKPQIDYDVNRTQYTDPAEKYKEQVRHEADLRLQNRQKYGIEASDEEYKILNEVIANSENPNEESFKTACALQWARNTQQPFSECYANIDGYIQELWHGQKSTSYKNAFVAITDMFKMGMNNVEMGTIGARIRAAEGANDKEALEVLTQYYNALLQDNETRIDNAPRKWTTEVLKAGAQALPYTGAVMGASMLGSFIPGLGAYAGFEMSRELMGGQAYMDMRSKGIDADIARPASEISGITQAVIESTLGKVAEFGGAAIGAVTKKGSKAISNVVSEKIANAMQKKFVLGTGQKLAIKLITGYLTELPEEGAEEFLQSVSEKGIENAAISKQNKRNKATREELLAQAAEELSDELVNSLQEEIYNEYPDIDLTSKKEIWEEAKESFKGGVMGAIALGIVPTAINTTVTAKNYNVVKEAAENIPSKEAFKKLCKEEPLAQEVFNQFEEGEERNKAIEQTWENSQTMRDKRDREIIESVQETTSFSENMEEAPQENEQGETEIVPPVRDENGRLYTSNDLSNNEEGENQTGTFKVGNKEASDKNLYGYIKYTLDDKTDTVTITDFKTTAYRRGLTNEIFDEFAQEFAGKNIEWNPVSKAGKDLKNTLIQNNLSGKNNGLNYYTQEGLSDIETRKTVAKQISKYMPNLNKEQKSAAVALLEAGARRQGFSLTDYVNNYGIKIESVENYADKTRLVNEMFKTTYDNYVKDQGQNATTEDFETYITKSFGIESTKNISEAEQNRILQQNVKGFANIRELEKQVKAVIYAGEKADFSTFAHEVSHIWQSQLTGELKEQAEKAFNVKNGDWNNSYYTFADGHKETCAEAFARGFEDYLKNGKAPNEQIKNLFQKFAEFLQDVYKTLKNFITMTPEIEAVYNQLMDADDSILKQAEKAVEDGNKELIANLKRQQEERQKKQEEEQANKKQAEEDLRAEQEEITLNDENIAEPDLTLTDEEVTGTEKELSEKDKTDVITTEEELEKELKKLLDFFDEQAIALKHEEEFKKVLEQQIKNDALMNSTPAKATEVAQVITDASEPKQAKVEVATEAAAEERKYEFDIFQLAGLEGVRNLVSANERAKRVQNYYTALKMWERENKGYDKNTLLHKIKMITGWELNASGKWVYETDDSIGLINQNVKTLINEGYGNSLATMKPTVLSAIYKNDELYEMYPIAKDFKVTFYTGGKDVNAFITADGINVSVIGLTNADVLKRRLVHEIQHIIQAVENAAEGDTTLSKTGIHGKDFRQLWESLQKAQIADDKMYDAKKLDVNMEKYLNNEAEIDARNVARRAFLTANERRSSLVSETQDNKAKLFFQIIGEKGATNLDIAQEASTRLDNLAIAKQMEASGKDAKTIRLATSWEKGKGGNWRYEIDDSNTQLYDEHFFPKRHIGKDSTGYAKIDEAIKANGYDFSKIPVQDMQIWEAYKNAENEFVREYIDFENGKENWKKSVDLERVIDAPELFKAYPQLKKTQFIIDSLESGNQGKYDYSNNTITLNKGAGKSVLLHEIQHAIQFIEGFAVGGSSKGKVEVDGKLYNNTFDAYQSLAGEVEARNVQTRISLSKEDRLNTLLSETEDVSPDDQIILFQGLTADTTNDKTMYGVHNLSAENLRHVLKMGGLANPSIAVLDMNKQGLKNFGEISLIPYNNMLEKGRGNKGTFGADIYSPTYPSIENVVTDIGTRKINSILWAVAEKQPEVAKELARKITYRIENANGALTQNEINELGLQIPFLAEQGKNDFYKYTKNERFDEYGTRKAAQEIIDADEELKKQFEEYAKEKVERIEKIERIFNGFTPSGERKYLLHTLENVSKYMKKQGLQDGEHFNYGLGSTRAKFAPKFTTLQQIKKAKDRLVTTEEFEEIKNSMEERFEKIIDLLGEGDYSVGQARFDEAFTQNNTSPIEYLQNEFSLNNMSDEDIAEILDFANALKEMPTEYFESKFERPVYLSEFAGAVIPKNLDADLKQALQDAGLLLKEYDSEESREQITNEALKEFNEQRQILFQNVYHGSGASFGKFNTEQYGFSGEGSMSFGWGTYLTSDEKIARDYAERSIRRKIAQLSVEKEKEYKKFNEEIHKRNILIGLNKNNNNLVAKAKKELKKIEQEKEKFIKENALNNRNLYSVDIPDNSYLEWYRELKESDITAILGKAAERVPEKNFSIKYLMQDFRYGMTGENLYKEIVYMLGSKKEASKFLHSIGYAGIKYPAGTIHGTGNGAYNYVIFNDEDAKIVDHLLFQTQQELYKDAANFDNWQEFMEYYENAGGKPEVSLVPEDVNAAWYKATWEMAKGINHEVTEDTATNEKPDQQVMDAMFVSKMEDKGVLEDFLQQIAYYNNLDLDLLGTAVDEEDAAQREKDAKIKEFIQYKLRHGSWLSNATRVNNGEPLTSSTRKRLLNLIRLAAREYRDIYTQITGNTDFAVPKEQSYFNEYIKDNAKKLNKLLDPEEADALSPEQLRILADNLSDEVSNKEIAQKIKDGTLRMDSELKDYIKRLENRVKLAEERYSKLDKETKADYGRIKGYAERRILDTYDELLKAKSKLTDKQNILQKKVAAGLKITQKYQQEVYKAQATYDDIFITWNNLTKVTKLSAEIQEAMKRKEAYIQTIEEQARLKNDKAILTQISDMRKKLVKNAMRRVPLERIDYDYAKKIIATQRLFYPNLKGDVNKWIGERPIYLRGIVSEYLTNTERREQIDSMLARKAQTAGKRTVESIKELQGLLKNLKSSDDVNQWSDKQKNILLRLVPENDWVKELNLEKLEAERQETMQLDIKEEGTQYKIKTVKDKNGKEKTLVYYKPEYSEEVGNLVKDAIGADLFNQIINIPFENWTTSQMEKFAKRIRELYTEGRDSLAEKRQAQKDNADAIREQIRQNIKSAGIEILPSDTPEEKAKKEEQILKMLGSSVNKGTFGSQKEKRFSKVDKLLHGYADANIRRVARILDNQTDGINVQELYFKENDCYEAKQKSIKERNEKIQKVLKDEDITIADLYQTINVDGTEYSFDDLLYILAADKDYKDVDGLVKDGNANDPYALNDDYAPTARNAVMFGNIASSDRDVELKEQLSKEDKETQERFKNGDYTAEEAELLNKGFSLTSTPGTQAYILNCHLRYAKVIEAAQKMLEENPKFQKLMDAIDTDYTQQFERMQQVCIEEFNSAVARVGKYVPLVRLENNGDTNEAIVKADLLAASGASTGRTYVDKGMTQKRVSISPLHQKPIEMGLYKTWADATERTEHFINYAAYVRELNRVYKGKDAQFVRRYIESRFGKGMNEYIDNYISEVANPNATSATGALDQIVRTLRGKTAPAYLAWKASSIIKQAATSPMPYMQFVSPAEYLKACFDVIASKGALYDDIKAKSIYMDNRVMDPLMDLIKEQMEKETNPILSKLNSFESLGMQGLEWIDWACVSPGWLACYRKKFAQLQEQNDINVIESIVREENERLDPSNPERLTNDQIRAEAESRAMTEQQIEDEAVLYADDCTRLCQPSNRAVDLAPLFKSRGEGSEIAKAFLQFQTSLNVIWQNIRYDIPFAMRQKQFKQIVGIIFSYVFAGVLVNSITEGYGTDEKDKDKKRIERLRKFVYYSTTQFSDSIPVIGNAVSSVNSKIIGGSKGYFNPSSEDLTPMLTKALRGTASLTKGNWEKALQNYAEAAGLATGLPVSGTKEALQVLGIGDNEKGLDFKPQAVLGRRD